MSQQTSLILDLIRFSLQILQARIDDSSMPAVDNRSLLLYTMSQNDNYSETPIEIDKVIGLFPFVCIDMERDPRFHALCRDLATDRRFRKWSMPDGAIIPGTEICMGSGVLISILWRYLNITGSLSWNQALLDVLLSESEQTLDRGSLRVDMVLPLVGLSGGYVIPRIELDQGWYLREMRPDEHTIFSKHIQQEIKLPCTMAYPGDAPPPFLRYALVRESWPVPFSILVSPGNVIDPEFLPFNEIDFYLSLLQVSTAQAEPGPNFSISSPAIMYRSEDWTMNTFGNPFNINFSWPLDRNYQSPRFYRPWFAAPGNWNEWVMRILSFINGASDDERRRISLALRWYAESVRSYHLEDRLIKLMIAADALFVSTDASRGRGTKIGQNMAKWCHNIPEEQREYRRMIQKIYGTLRNDLMHDGATEEMLNRKIQNDRDLADLENVLHCANILETFFLCAWNSMVVKSRKCETE
ncbi:MAG: hypothetical protein WCK00_03470 [Deltaproteobacteria bacterium]